MYPCKDILPHDSCQLLKNSGACANDVVAKTCKETCDACYGPPGPTTGPPTGPPTGTPTKPPTLPPTPEPPRELPACEKSN